MQPTPRLRALGLALLSFGVAVYGWWPALAAYKNTQGGDGQYFHKLVEAGRVAVAHHHELPLWDPYECGGRPLWDNPQSLVAAPLIWLALVLGTTATMKLWYIAHTAAGFASMWLLCRKEVGVSAGAAFAASLGWACGGFHMHHFSGGHAAFVTFELMPLALLLWRRADHDDRAAIGVGLLVALLGFEGGALPLLYVAVLLGGETFTRLWPVARIVRIVRAGAIVLGVGIGVGAVRLLPVIDQLRSHKRPLGVDLDHMTLSSLVDAFVNGYHAHLHRMPGHAYVWGEYAAYLGWVLLLLALVGIVVGGRRHAWVGALLVLGLALMIGHQGPLSPWGILHKYVYPLKEMRVPSRFNAQASLLLLVYAAIATDRLAALARRLPELSRGRIPVRAVPYVRAVIPMIAIAGAGDVLGHGLQLAHEYPTGAPQSPNVEPSARLFIGGGSAGFVNEPQQNRGRLSCYEPWAPYEGAPLWTGDVPQAKSIDPAVIVSNVTRTQNTFSMDVQSDGPSRVLLNSSFDLNWRSNIGAPVEVDKQLAIDVPAGVHHVRAYYRPRLLTFGAIVTAISIAAVVVALRRIRKSIPQRGS